MITCWIGLVEFCSVFVRIGIAAAVAVMRLEWF